MKVKRRIVIVLTAALAIIIMTAMGVYAADYEVLETDVSTPSSGCVMLGVYGSYHSDAQNALNRINEIRHEACYDGKTPDPRNSSRMLSPSDYVPMKWSTSLEKIARIRAVEGGIARGHVRHNGKASNSISYGGISSSGENLAYNYSTSMVYSVDAWYEERNDWVEQNQGTVTGHYTSLINPSYTYVGLGLFESDAGPWPCNCAGEFSSSAGSLGTTFLNAPKNVMQKIEVKESYIDEYYINQRADLNLTGQQKLEFRVKDTVPEGKSSSKLWVIDTITWSSSNDGIVSVASDGTATGKGLGTTTVTATAGSKTASLSITVTCKHNYEFGEPDASGKCKGTCTICGDTINIVPPTQFTAYWRNDQTATSEYYSSLLPSDNPNGSNVGIMFSNIDGDTGYQDMVVETSDPVGAPVTKLGSTFSIGVQTAGLVDVHIYPKYNPAAGKTYTLRFGDEGSANIGDAEATLGTLEYTYNGSAKKPSVSVTYDGKPLSTSYDYTVSYEDNINAGTAKAIITGKGIWSGTITKEFTINPADISGSARVTLSPTSCVCDGTPKEPDTTVTYSGKTLTKGTDYDVEYTNNVYLGKATATVTGKGNYTGSKSADFQMTHTDHDYSETINQAPTCTEEGSATYTCTVCRYSYDKTLPATGIHTPVTDAKVDPTCTKTGLTEGSHCSVCGNVLTEQETIPALGHTPGKPVQENEVAATCTKDGSYDEVVYCEVCNDELSREAKTSEALGHDYKDIPGTAVAPSCTEKGKEADKKCSRCEDTITGEAIAALGHTPGTPVHENEVDATCTDNGSYEEVIYCEVCNDELSRDSKTSEALGHDWGKWTETTPATCIAGGVETRTCKRDATHTETRNTDPKQDAHSWGEWTKINDEQHQRVCRNDANHKETGDHSWDEGVETTPASETEDGVKTYTCSVCGATKTEDIPSQLVLAKQDALARLKQVNLNNYSGVERTKVENALKTAIEAIENATSVSEVTDAENAANSTIKAQKTDAQKAAEAKPNTKPEVVDLKAVKGLKLKAAKGKITVKWKKAAKKELKTFQYYEIQYTLNGTFKDYPPKTVGKKKASVTVKKLLKKKRYTVKIRRCRDDGSVLHVSPWKVKKAKTK